MSRDVVSCSSGDSLNVAAQIMWENDFGCVPVIEAGRLFGIVTDRDVCMAAYMQGKALSEIAVAGVCARQVHTCHRDEPVLDAVQTMARARVRRLPVVEADRQLVGIFSLSDVARNLWFTHSLAEWTESSRRLASLLEAVSRPRTCASDYLVPMSDQEREILASFDEP
jgi:CBS-domain-containing membrane protein